MSETEQSATGPGPLERLAGKGDEALRRVAEEIGRAAPLTDARGRLEQVERSVLDRLNIAAADEVGELRATVAELERRLLRIEEQLVRRDPSESL
jgi:hypothetical protein